MVAAVAWLWLGFDVNGEPAWMQGFKGNLFGEILGGVAFVILGLHLGQRLDKLVEKDIEDRKHAERVRRLEEQFDHFLRYEAWHDARFPSLVTPAHPIGLDYTIEPVRDESGEPRVHRTEMHTSYLVRVREPAQRAFSDALHLADYEAAPIHCGEYYLARFYNGSWHMGQSSVGDDWLPCYLSGKLGHAEFGFYANSLLDGLLAAPPNSKIIKQTILDEHGRESNGGWQVSVYRADDGRVWVQPCRTAPPKPVYIEVDVLNDTKRPVFEDFEGYFPGEARERLFELIERELAKVGHALPEIPNH